MPVTRLDNMLLRARRDRVVDTALRLGHADAAKSLGISRTTSWRILKEYGKECAETTFRPVVDETVHTPLGLIEDLAAKRREVKALTALVNYYEQKNKL